MDINKILKLLFILSATAFLITLVSVPQSHCDTCKIEYKGKILDGVEAWKAFEAACISYDKPWTTIEIPDNFTFVTS